MRRRTFLGLGLGVLGAGLARANSWAGIFEESPGRFPKDFWWGTASSSYQIEGAWKADGKGESIWDRFAHTPGRIKNGDTGDVACDHYHRYKEDVALMRAMNLNSYRFSISWPRIQPKGRGKPNHKGLDFYQRLVDGLLKANIRPVPTLYHWDLPVTLEDAGGWPNRDTGARFAEYAEIMARHLGDRAKTWLLFNEPYYFCQDGYFTGLHAPGRKSFSDFMRATHVVNLAHGLSYRAMKAARTSLSISTALSMAPQESATDSAEDRAAAERAHNLRNVWFLEPALRGRYPEAFVTGSLPEMLDIRAGDMETVRAPFDFVAINLYGRSVIRHDPEKGMPGLQAAGVERREGPLTDNGWEVWPNSLYEMVMRIWRDYRMPIEITENGCAYNDGPDAHGVVRDTRRIEFYRSYLGALLRAMQEGADVRGFHAWSLLDNFEWLQGFTQRFGLVYVDFATLKRTIKESGRWYGRVAGSGELATAGMGRAVPTGLGTSSALFLGLRPGLPAKRP